MSSVAGRFARPFLGAYAASKFGLEGLSDALRRELTVYGVEVVLIEPGMIATPIWDKAEEADLAAFDGTIYAAPGRRMQKWAVEAGPRAPRAGSRGAGGVLRALTAPRPPAPHPCRKKSLYGLYAPQPDCRRGLVDWLIARRLGLLPK